MKSFKLLSFFTISILLILNSCSIEKRVHMPGYHVEWHNSKGHVSEHKIKSEDVIRPEEQQQSAFQETDKKVEPIVISTLETENVSSEIEKTIPASTTLPEEVQSIDCDNIILRNGEAINAKVTEITENEIKYKKCSNLNGPTYSIYKSEVSVIKYVNGTEETFPIDPSRSNNVPPAERKSGAKVEGFAIAAFLFSIAGLFIAGFLFGLIAVIFSIISLVRIGNDPSRFKGKGLAIAGLIIGILDMILIYLLFAAILL